MLPKIRHNQNFFNSSTTTFTLNTDSGIVPCEGNNYNNDNYLDNSSMGGPLVGISWMPQSSVTITRIEVFTGEHIGPNALAIWSDDGGNPSRPLAVLGHTQVFNTSWQGANFITPVAITEGVKYWVVWDTEGGEQCAVTDDPADIQQTYWGSYTGTVSGGADWFGPFSFSNRRWKFRMFCTETVGEAQIDIKPGSCPNPVNIKSGGVIPVAILGTENLSVSEIDMASIRLERVAPIRSRFEDVSSPIFDKPDICDCLCADPDGLLDIILHFDKQEIVKALRGFIDGEVLVLKLTAELKNGAFIEAHDCIVIISKGKWK